jgi:hypothetical protein
MLLYAQTALKAHKLIFDKDKVTLSQFICLFLAIVAKLAILVYEIVKNVETV